MATYIDVEEAKQRTGLRLVVAPGIPGPWGEAIKGICYVKKMPFTLVRFDIGAENKALAEWSAQASVPVMIWNDEFPKSIWNQQLALAERLAPAPSLIPADITDRMLLFGFANELCGENGFGWCCRLMIVHQTLSTPGIPAENRAFAHYFGAKYGYSPEAGQAAAARVIAILQALGTQLERQHANGSRYFIGHTLSALDIYWAAFATLIEPLPEDVCPMGPIYRAMYTNTEASVQAAVPPRLMAHRDFIYQQHLQLPIDL